MATQRPIKSLSELMDGGVEERFNQELEKVWANVYDPNTDAKKPREVTLRVRLCPTSAGILRFSRQRNSQTCATC